MAWSNAILKLKIGDDNTYTVTVTESNSDAVVLTGGTMKVKIARNLNIADVDATYYTEITSFPDAANGIHDFTIPDSASAGFSPRQEIIQVRFIDSSGTVVSSDIDNIILGKNLIDDE